jgi:hypothetical protein
MVDVEHVVHRHYLHVLAACRRAEDHSADPSESIDADLDHDFFLSLPAGMSPSHCLSLLISMRI